MKEKTRTSSRDLSFGIGEARLSMSSQNPQRDLKHAIGKLIIGAAGIVTVWYGGKWLFSNHPSGKQDKPQPPAANTPDEQEEYIPAEAKSVKDMFNSPKAPISLSPLQSSYLLGGDLLFLSGDAGANKSTAAFQLALACTTGTPQGLFPDEVPCNPLPALVVDTEMQEDDYKSRYTGIWGSIPLSLKRISGDDYKDLSECSKDIRREAWKWDKGGIVIVDNATVSMNVLNAEKVKAFMRSLKKIQKDYSKKFHAALTMIVIGHMNKDGKNFTGSQQLKNLATKLYMLTKGENPDERILTIEKDRLSGHEGQVLTLRTTKADNWLHLEFVSLYDPREEDDVVKVKDGRKVTKCTDAEKVAIYEAHTSGEKPDVIAQQYDISPRTVYRIIKEISERKQSEATPN